MTIAEGRFRRHAHPEHARISPLRETAQTAQTQGRNSGTRFCQGGRQLAQPLLRPIAQEAQRQVQVGQRQPTPGPHNLGRRFAPQSRQRGPLRVIQIEREEEPQGAS